MNEVYTLEKLFGRFPGGIRVPRIQRGYVQGRENSKGEAIRAEFVPALVAAIFGEKPLSLDFLYGVTVEGKHVAERCLMPLDGQQRLTTLALLAWLCGKWRKEWRFAYESRRIPEMFMEGLLNSTPPEAGKASEIVRSAGWFLPVWENDPTVAGMLRMLDALDTEIGGRDRETADFDTITFLLHGIDGTVETFDHIFRKMNARGKELSPWENLKAMLDKHIPQTLADEWREKVDGDWPEEIWSHVGGNVVALDNVMEKVLRMAYARFASFGAQSATLWQMESKLAGVGEEVFDEGTRSSFYQTSAAYFDELQTVARCWTEERTQNALWWETGDEKAFWEWLSNGQPASPADHLRMAFLTEKPRCGDDHRRKRILLNLLDASSITKDNMAKAQEAGLAFLAGALDLETLKEKKVGYSPEQLNDEIEKRTIDENSIVDFEKDKLVFHGSLRFIGWAPFRDANDIKDRLAIIQAAIAEDKWLEFYQDLVSRIPPEKFNGRYAYTPCGDMGKRQDVWKTHVFTDGRFIDAVKNWHEAPGSHPELPAWVRHLADLLRTGKVVKPTLRCWDGWMFLLQTDSYRSANSIRLDRNEIERFNRQLLKAEEIFYSSLWPWAEAKEVGTWYNVCDESWRTSKCPPKGTRDSDGHIHFI